MTKGSAALVPACCRTVWVAGYITSKEGLASYGWQVRAGCVWWGRKGVHALLLWLPAASTGLWLVMETRWKM